MERRTSDDRGAEMVEFAIVVPVLLLLVLGIIEFGFLLHEQGTLAGAARESARDMAIHNKVDQAKNIAVSAAGPVVKLTTSDVTITPAACEPGKDVTVSIVYTHSSLTGLFAFIDRTTPIQLTGKGVMRCGG